MYTESRQPVFMAIGPREAEKYLAINNFPGQRKYNPLKGRRYATNMGDGTHRRIEIATVKVKSNDTSYLMNGQHNCEAVKIHGRAYPGVVSYYMADTMEDAWRLFATFDVHGTRTERQFMKSRRGLFEHELLWEVPLAVLQACGTSLLALEQTPQRPVFTITPKDKTTKADMVERYPDEVLFVATFGESRHMLVVGAVTAMIATWRKNADAAIAFWTSVSTGEMLTRTSPAYRLRESLLNNQYLGVNRNSRSRHGLTYSFCIAWWNTYRTGKSRRSVKPTAMASFPLVLA